MAVKDVKTRWANRLYDLSPNVRGTIPNGWADKASKALLIVADCLWNAAKEFANRIEVGPKESASGIRVVPEETASRIRVVPWKIAPFPSEMPLPRSDLKPFWEYELLAPGVGRLDLAAALGSALVDRGNIFTSGLLTTLDRLPALRLDIERLPETWTEMCKEIAGLHTQRALESTAPTVLQEDRILTINEYTAEYLLNRWRLLYGVWHEGRWRLPLPRRDGHLLAVTSSELDGILGSVRRVANSESPFAAFWVAHALGDEHPGDLLDPETPLLQENGGLEGYVRGLAARVNGHGQCKSKCVHDVEQYRLLKSKQDGIRASATIQCMDEAGNRLFGNLWTLVRARCLPFKGEGAMTESKESQKLEYEFENLVSDIQTKVVKAIQGSLRLLPPDERSLDSNRVRAPRQLYDYTCCFLFYLIQTIEHCLPDRRRFEQHLMWSSDLAKRNPNYKDLFRNFWLSILKRAGEVLDILDILSDAEAMVAEALRLRLWGIYDQTKAALPGDLATELQRELEKVARSRPDKGREGLPSDEHADAILELLRADPVDVEARWLRMRKRLDGLKWSPDLANRNTNYEKHYWAFCCGFLNHVQEVLHNLPPTDDKVAKAFRSHLWGIFDQTKTDLPGDLATELQRKLKEAVGPCPDGHQGADVDGEQAVAALVPVLPGHVEALWVRMQQRGTMNAGNQETAIGSDRKRPAKSYERAQRELVTMHGIVWRAGDTEVRRELDSRWTELQPKILLESINTVKQHGDGEGEELGDTIPDPGPSHARDRQDTRLHDLDYWSKVLSRTGDTNAYSQVQKLREQIEEARSVGRSPEELEELVEHVERSIRQRVVRTFVSAGEQVVVELNRLYETWDAHKHNKPFFGEVLCDFAATWQAVTAREEYRRRTPLGDWPLPKQVLAYLDRTPKDLDARGYLRYEPGDIPSRYKEHYEEFLKNAAPDRSWADYRKRKNQGDARRRDVRRKLRRSETLKRHLSDWYHLLDLDSNEMDWWLLGTEVKGLPQERSLLSCLHWLAQNQDDTDGPGGGAGGSGPTGPAAPRGSDIDKEPQHHGGAGEELADAQKERMKDLDYWSKVLSRTEDTDACSQVHKLQKQIKQARSKGCWPEDLVDGAERLIRRSLGSLFVSIGERVMEELNALYETCNADEHNKPFFGEVLRDFAATWQAVTMREEYRGRTPLGDWPLPKQVLAYLVRKPDESPTIPSGYEEFLATADPDPEQAEYEQRVKLREDLRSEIRRKLRRSETLKRHLDDWYRLLDLDSNEMDWWLLGTEKEGLPQECSLRSCLDLYLDWLPPAPPPGPSRPTAPRGRAKQLNIVNVTDGEHRYRTALCAEVAEHLGALLDQSGRREGAGPYVYLWKHLEEGCVECLALYLSAAHHAASYGHLLQPTAATVPDEHRLVEDALMALAMAGQHLEDATEEVVAHVGWCKDCRSLWNDIRPPTAPEAFQPMVAAAAAHDVSAPKALAVSLAAAPPGADAEPRPIEGATADGLLRWWGLEDPEAGTLRLRLRSAEPALAGVRLRLRAGPTFSREMVLQARAGGPEVGADILLSRAERAALQPGAALRVEVVFAEEPEGPEEAAPGQPETAP